MPKTHAVTFSIPGWLSWTLAPNDDEQRAAWHLYVELATRVATQPFDRSTGSLRGALASLHEVFGLTRAILREAGPGVAQSEQAFGPLAIGFLTDVVGPFLLRWHEPLAAYEALRPADASVIEHEQTWERFADATAELQELQLAVREYGKALAQIAGVTYRE